MDAVLEQITELVVIVLLRKSHGKELVPLAPKVRAIIEHELAAKRTLIGMDRLADKLCMAKSTLRRRLAIENTAYQIIADECRVRIAKALLERGMSCEDIAYYLDFSVPCGFTRAFRKWTGLNPSVYRENLQ